MLLCFKVKLMQLADSTLQDKEKVEESHIQQQLENVTG